MKRVGLIQSNYIPWKGYFDVIHDVDVFVFHDDVQYTKGDWRNRNRIKTDGGERWLTIPVGVCEHRLICDVPLPSGSWAKDHWRRLHAAYHRAPYFASYREYVEALFRARQWRTLSELNQAFTTGIARDLLGITTEFVDSRSFALTGVKGARVIELLRKTGADVYVSGPAARDYLTDDCLAEAGISVEWKDYSGYPEYDQLHAPFSHAVSILDLIFHTGPRAAYYIWGWRAAARAAA
jgi:hypothetical protein